MKTKTIRVKKLWEGFASLRSTVVQEAIKHGQGIKVRYMDEEMTLPFEKLLHPLHIGGERVIESKFNHKTYTLFDFPWQPDGRKVEIYKTFDRKGNRLL